MRCPRVSGEEFVLMACARKQGSWDYSVDMPALSVEIARFVGRMLIDPVVPCLQKQPAMFGARKPFAALPHSHYEILSLSTTKRFATQIVSTAPSFWLSISADPRGQARSPSVDQHHGFEGNSCTETWPLGRS